MGASAIAFGDEMSPRKSAEPFEQITIRIDPQWLAQADELASLLSRPGEERNRADALRLAIARGILELTKERRLEIEAVERAAVRKPASKPKSASATKSALARKR